MISLLRQHSHRLWTTLHRAFDSTDPAMRWTARAIWALLTAGVCLVLSHTATWAARTAGASAALTAWLAVLVVAATFSTAVIAVLAGPGRPGGCRSALTALALVTGIMVLAAFSRLS